MILPERPVAATAMTWLAGKAAGYSGATSRSCPLLPRGDGHEDAGVAGRLDGLLERLAAAGARHRHVDDLRAVGDGVADGLGHASRPSPTASASSALRTMSRARQATPVTPTPVGAAGGEDAGDVRAVAVVVGRVAVAVDEVRAVDVVHEAVAVVVDAVAGDLARVAPEVVAQVGVGEVGARVDDRDDGAPARRDVPRALDAEEAVVRERPLLLEQLVARDRLGRVAVVQVALRARHRRCGGREQRAEEHDDARRAPRGTSKALIVLDRGAKRRSSVTTRLLHRAFIAHR